MVLSDAKPSSTHILQAVKIGVLCLDKRQSMSKRDLNALGSRWRRYFMETQVVQWDKCDWKSWTWIEKMKTLNTVWMCAKSQSKN